MFLLKFNFTWYNATQQQILSSTKQHIFNFSPYALNKLFLFIQVVFHRSWGVLHTVQVHGARSDLVLHTHWIRYDDAGEEDHQQLVRDRIDAEALRVRIKHHYHSCVSWQLFIVRITWENIKVFVLLLKKRWLKLMSITSW